MLKYNCSAFTKCFNFLLSFLQCMNYHFLLHRIINGISYLVGFSNVLQNHQGALSSRTRSSFFLKRPREEKRQWEFCHFECYPLFLKYKTHIRQGPFKKIKLVGGVTYHFGTARPCGFQNRANQNPPIKSTEVNFSKNCQKNRQNFQNSKFFKSCLLKVLDD